MKLARTAAAVLCSAALASSMTLAVPAISQVADSAGITAGWSEQSSAYAAAIKLSTKSLCFKQDVATAATVILRGVPNSARGKVKWSAPKALSVKFPKKGDKRKAIISCADFSGGKYTITASYNGKKYKCAVTVEKAAVETGVAKVITALESSSHASASSDGKKMVASSGTTGSTRISYSATADKASNSIELYYDASMSGESVTLYATVTDSNAVALKLVYMKGIKMYSANATVSKASLKASSEVNWNASLDMFKDASTAAYIDELAKAAVDGSLSSWDVLLKTKVGYDYGMNALGFSKL